MDNMDTFKLEQVLQIVETKLIKESNSCEFEFYLKLKKEIQEKLGVKDETVN